MHDSNIFEDSFLVQLIRFPTREGFFKYFTLSERKTRLIYGG